MEYKECAVRFVYWYILVILRTGPLRSCYNTQAIAGAVLVSKTCLLISRFKFGNVNKCIEPDYI